MMPSLFTTLYLLALWAAIAAGNVFQFPQKHALNVILTVPPSPRTAVLASTTTPPSTSVDICAPGELCDCTRIKDKNSDE